MISGGATDLDSVQSEIAEAERYDGAAGAGRNSQSFVLRVDPVADAGGAIPRVEPVQSNGATKMAVPDDHRGERGASFVFVNAFLEKANRMVDRVILIEPGKPAAQAVAIALDCGKQFPGVIMRHRVKFQTPVDPDYAG